MLGRQERVLEERTERIMGGVRVRVRSSSSGMNCCWGSERRLLVIFWMIWDWDAELGDILALGV